VVAATVGSNIIPILPELFNRRQKKRQSSACPELWALLDQVVDPEIPVISLWDLGVLQDIIKEDQQINVVITPTYSGCPAMFEMERDIVQTLSAAGYPSVAVETQLSPAWSTEMISAEGRQQLFDYGIAPPSVEKIIICPQCSSKNTQLLSQFGSTACKALYKCNDCLEPFDYFKCL
jgi:ring-1,2-phenylacetyl-CoA epoxidase subunit PaaD